jgi:hypothetical protein
MPTSPAVPPTVLDVDDRAPLYNGVAGSQVVQLLEATQRSAEPVSRMTWKDCGLVPEK